MVNLKNGRKPLWSILKMVEKITLIHFKMRIFFKTGSKWYFGYFQNGSKWFPAIFRVNQSCFWSYFKMDQNDVSTILKMHQSGFRPFSRWIKIIFWPYFKIDQNVVSAIFKMYQFGFRPFSRWIKVIWKWIIVMFYRLKLDRTNFWIQKWIKISTRISSVTGWKSKKINNFALD